MIENGPFRFRVSPSLNFSEVGEFHCGLARVRQQGKFGTGKWGYSDADGRLALPFDYREAGDFNDGIAVVKVGRFEYFIDTTGKPVFNGAYDQADNFHDGFAVVKSAAGWFAIDRGGNGRRLLFDEVYSFNEGHALVLGDDRWTYLDTSLTPILTVEYDEVWSFCGGLAMIAQGKKRGFIDLSGRIAVLPRYDDARSFDEGLAAVMMVVNDEECWGYIDRSGKEVIPLSFELADSFQQERATVRVSGKYGHINAWGKFTTPPVYEAAGAFHDGFATIKGAAIGYVDKDGEMYISELFQQVKSFSENLAWVETDDGWGILEILVESGTP